MGRRIRWLALVMVACFAVLLVQLVNIQFRRAPALASSPQNPRNQVLRLDNQRGEILASDGTVLARSVLSHAGRNQPEYLRRYPTGSLFSEIVGYDSFEYGTTGVEYEYDSDLTSHSHAATTLGQLFNPPPAQTDNITLTLVPSLQRLAASELASVSGPNKDGAVVVLDPHTGAVLAMYSSPTYDPSGLTSMSSSVQTLARLGYLATDAEGFSPSVPLTTSRSVPPGSTAKVMTTSAIFDLKPSLATYNFPVRGCLDLTPYGSNKLICNDALSPQTANPCGGTIASMLPESCDPGYAYLGIQLGGALLAQQAQSFGYDSVPPIDLPGVAASAFPVASDFQSNKLGLPGVAYSAFGQQDVSATALQNALMVAGIADGGVIMTPHVMAQVRASSGKLVESYQPKVWLKATTQSAAAQVTSLMQSVVTLPIGTAYGCIGANLDAAVKTGTSQVGNAAQNTDDWMVGFAPASDPRVAVAVDVPYQAFSASGARVAGPIMNAMLAAALGLPAQPSC